MSAISFSIMTTKLLTCFRKIMLIFKQNLYFVLLLFLYSSTWAQSFKISFPSNEIRLDTTVTIKTTNPDQNYNLTIQIGNKDSSFIIISQKQDLDTINIIQLLPDSQWDIPQTYTLFEFKDINLDGYSDLFVLKGIDWRFWGKTYDIWLFDKENQKFSYSKEFTTKVYTDYVLDEKNKTITSNWYALMELHEYGSNTYKIDGENLILIKRISKNFVDSNRYIWRHEELVNGKLEVIEEVFKNEDDEVIEDNK